MFILWEVQISSSVYPNILRVLFLEQCTTFVHFPVVLLFCYPILLQPLNNHLYSLFLYSFSHLLLPSEVTHLFIISGVN